MHQRQAEAANRLMAVAALFASLVPAWRATRVDPVRILKAESGCYSALRASSGLTWAARQAGTQAAPIATTIRIVPTRK